MVVGLHSTMGSGSSAIRSSTTAEQKLDKNQNVDTVGPLPDFRKRNIEHVSYDHKDKTNKSSTSLRLLLIIFLASVVLLELIMV